MKHDEIFNDLWLLQKAELVFMIEHYGIYLVLGIGLICLCVYVHFTRDDDNEL